MNLFIPLITLSVLGHASEEVICIQDSVINIGLQKKPIENQNFSFASVQSQEIFKNIKTLQMNLAPNEQFFADSTFGGYLTMFRNKEFFEISTFEVALEIEEGNERKSEIFFIKKKKEKFKIDSCKQIINIYQYNNLYFIICDEGANYLFYFLEQIISDDQLKAQYIYKLEKNFNCQDYFKMDNYYNIIFLARLNCSDWAVFKLENQKISILFEPSQFNFGILKSISVSVQINLIFFNCVYILTNFHSSEFKIIYQNKEKEILYHYGIHMFDLENLIVYKDSFNNQNEISNRNLIIYRSQIPKQILKKKNEIFIIFDDFVNIFQNNVIYELPLKFDDLLEYYPYFFGINSGIIDIYRLSLLNLFFDCNQLNKTKSDKIIWKNQNYQQIRQNFQLGQTYYILVSTNRQFIIESPVATQSVIPQFQMENNQVKCEQQDFQVQDCLNQKFDFFWSRYIIIDNQLFAIYQSKQQKIYIQNCTNQNISYLGAVEKIPSENIFLYSSQFILINSEGKKITIVDIKNYNNINMKQYEFKKEIIHIVCVKNSLYIIFSTCDVVQIEKQYFTYFGDIGFSTTFQKCDKQTVYNNYQLLKFNKNQLTLITANFIKKFYYEVGEIIQLIIFDSNTKFIMLIQQGEQNIFFKYQIYEDQLIKNFQLPTYMYTYASPIKYICNEKYLVIAAFKNELNKVENVLLIYDMNNEKYNILIDIIEKVDINRFSFVDKSRLIFYSQDQLYYKVLSKLTFSCTLQEPFIEFQKYVQLPIIMKSKIFEQQQNKGELTILITNFIPNLFLRNAAKIVLQNQLEDFQLDPRLYIVGPISSISSQDYDIQQPIKLIMRKENINCAQIKRHICNDKINQRFFDLFLINNINIIQISNDYVIISKHNYNQQIIQFLSLQFQILYEGEISNSHNFIEAQFFQNYIFLISNYIVIYQINKNISLLQTLEFPCIYCKIIKSSKEENIFLIYSKLFQGPSFKYLKIDNSTNQIMLSIVNLRFENLEFPNNLLLFIVSFDKFDKYHASKLLIYNQQSSLYIFKIKLYDGLYEYRIENPLAVIRLFNGSNHVLLHFLTENLFLFQHLQNKLYLYNISKSKDFELIDPIHDINVQNEELQVINSSHFLVIGENNKYFSLYQLQPYIFHLKNKQQLQTSILIQNDVSQIQLCFEDQSLKNEKIKYQQLIFSTIIICFTLFLILTLIKLKQKNKLKEIQQEIEM